MDERPYMNYNFEVAHLEGIRFHAYIARITGPDPNYILGRDFLTASVRRAEGRTFFRYRLYDGVYDLTVKYYDKLTGEYLNRERRWLVMLDGDLYQYNEEDANPQYVLYAAFNLALQTTGGAAA